MYNLALNTSYDVVPDTAQLLELLTYRRPEGKGTQKHFMRKYLLPVFGPADKHGNFMLVVGDDPKPPLCFTAHHDTVHNREGRQKVLVTNGMAHVANTDKSNCLGADCTTGIWLILHMIKAEVPARYIIFAGEELGGIGSGAILKEDPDWIDETDFMISFDRKGYSSIITHQGWGRTASNEFAHSLSDILGGTFKPDDTGTFTDSAIFESRIPECSNLSVGYFAQHTVYENQDVGFAEELAVKLANADWTKLCCERDPNQVDYSDFTTYRGIKGWNSKNKTINSLSFDELVERNPKTAVRLMKTYGITLEDMLDEINFFGDLDGEW